jgi:hypothetical protein
MQRIPDHTGGASLEAPAPEITTTNTPGAIGPFGRWAVHPILLAIYPIISLLGENAREVRISSLSTLIGLVVLGAAALWLVLGIVTRDTRKSAVLASIAIVMFFTIDLALEWGSWLVYRASEFWVRTDINLSVGAIAIPELIALAGIAHFLTKKKRNMGVLTAFLNVFALVLVAIPLIQVVTVKAPSVGRAPRAASAFPVASVPAASEAADPRPDIYYIILDGYARSDIMKRFFHFDNSAFLDRLEKKGFYVARESVSNYCQTALSLSSSLNAEYLDELVKGLGNDQTELSDLIGRNNVVASLKPLGYKFVTFATGFDPTDHPEADLYLSPHPFSNGFERMVVDITPLHRIWPNPRTADPTQMSRERTFFLLGKLPEVSSDPAPTFTLAHVFCPHPPIIYGENGEDVRIKYQRYASSDGDRIGGRFRDPNYFAKGYRDQSAFITNRIEQMIDQLLARSTKPPIIILQSDHGSELNLDMHDFKNSDVRERLRILNTYFFPDRKYAALYQEISPVNSFRVVLNTYFGAKADLLPDKSFFSTWDEPYHFIEVTDQVRQPYPDLPTVSLPDR